MFDFLKICGMGLLYTILSPIFLLIFAIYLVYATLLLIVNLFKSIIMFFKGKSLINMKLNEDVVAERIINEKKLAIQNQINRQPSDIYQPSSSDQSQSIHNYNDLNKGQGDNYD